MRYLSILVLIGIAGLSLRAQPPKGGWAPFKKVGERLGVTNVVWDGSSLAFSNATRCVRFHSGQKRAEVNGVTVWMNQPPEGSPADGSWKMAALDLDFLTLAILPEKETAKPKPLHILLDPGHGGVDDGAVNGEVALSEKAFSLAIANRLGPLLEKAGFTVSYTRTNDVALSLGQRTRMVTPLKADLFISLHANHAANREAIGFETYVIPPSGFTGTSVGSRLCTWQPGNKNEFQSTSLGFAIQRRFSLSQTNRVDRGLKRQSYYVLRESPCPAVLIEFGFVSNNGEAGEMLSAPWQEAHARLVADAVTDYAKRIETLDRAVAQRAEEERKANEAWRAKLAKREAEKSARLATARTAAPPPPGDAAHQPLAAPFPLAPFPDDATPPPAPKPVVVERATNTAPLVVGRLIDFYMKEKPNE